MFRKSKATLKRGRKRGLLLALLVATACPMADAADILVTSDADTGAGTFRQAITDAVSGDRIVFDIAGTPTIVLLSDLPDINGDISFANNNVPDVTIDRNGNGPLTFNGSLVDPTILVINTFGGASPDADIVASNNTTIFGSGALSANLLVPGTLAPGPSASPGSIGTLDVTGDLDISGADFAIDMTGTGGLSNDLVNVNGIATVTGAVLDPNFVGTDFAVGDQFLVLDSTNPIVGTFFNQADAFQLPDNPFLEALDDTALGADDFGFVIADNNLNFTTVVSGCNQSSAAALLDQLRAGAPPASVVTLRNGSTAEVLNAINQLSGSIYPSLIGAEINHIQSNLESIRDLMIWHASTPTGRMTTWARGYGASGDVGQDDCETSGYLQRVGGIELGCGIGNGNGLLANGFAHLAGGTLESHQVDQSADVDSYRIGGSLMYRVHQIYVLGSAGAGVQQYDVRRSLNGFDGSTLAQSSVDGTAQFAYLETAFAAAWSPYLACHVTRVDMDPIRETGDAQFALSNSGGAGDSFRGVLGFAIHKSAPTALGLATTRLRFGWMHEYLNESETFVSQIAGGGTPTGSLVDRGVAPGRDWGFVRAQVEMGSLFGGQFMCAYEGQYSTNSSFNSLIGGVGWIF